MCVLYKENFPSVTVPLKRTTALDFGKNSDLNQFSLKN